MGKLLENAQCLRWIVTIAPEKFCVLDHDAENTCANWNLPTLKTMWESCAIAVFVHRHQDPTRLRILRQRFECLRS